MFVIIFALIHIDCIKNLMSDIFYGFRATSFSVTQKLSTRPIIDCRSSISSGVTTSLLNILNNVVVTNLLIIYTDVAGAEI